ncbi:MAG: DNRLRE domain-containing protein, partial [bacterium]
SAASSFTVDSATQLRAASPVGATTGPVSVTNAAGTAASASDFTVTAPPSSITLTPTDDTFGKSSRPTKVYGGSAELRVRVTSSSTNITYLKFNITGVSGVVQSAKIRLVVINPGPDGGSIYSVSNDYTGTTTPWDEAGLIWNNAPAINGFPLSSLGQVNLNETVEFDVTAAITGNGIYSFGIKNSASDAAKYSSKEGGTAPELVVTMETTAAKMRDPSSAASEDSQSSSDITETALVPVAFELGQNYPNPFNPTTTIEFSVPVQSHVKVSIYNLRGELVRRLLSREMPPGRHKVFWDSKNGNGVQVASGIYVYRMEATSSALKTEKGFVSSRRLVLMR